MSLSRTISILLAVASLPFGCTFSTSAPPYEGAGVDADPRQEFDASTPTTPDARHPDAARLPDARALVQPGGACTCDDDCDGITGYEAICYVGVCMHRAERGCAYSGSASECPDGSRCWYSSRGAGALCWPDCDTYECAGACDGDGSCVPSSATACDPVCGTACGP